MRTAAEAVRTQLNVVTGELERYFPQVNTTPLHSATNITAFANFPATQRALSNIPMTCERNRTLAWPGTEAPALESVRAPSVFTFVTDGVHSAVAQAKAAAGGKAVAVHGASVTQQCLAAGLLDEVQIHLAPVLLSGGTRLFEHLGGQYRLERTRVIETPNATHLRFRVIR
ncbi:dihydrofolate reductase family protein [Streptomyces sp. IB201691-2A2]|uniref:dihydrofolate reductase family protein n=1 Tax=Streptomyces sp. IB201691-2A2 TaxID=2561920 RepID=UPI0021B0C4CF|nr:dihydrofolate reductase family protein [Streptomyces sp. IB201691-2A2]